MSMRRRRGSDVVPLAAVDGAGRARGWHGPEMWIRQGNIAEGAKGAADAEREG